MDMDKPKKKKRNPLLAGLLWWALHIVLVLIPFVVVLPQFVPLQTYTHPAFRLYWILVWVFPLLGVDQVALGYMQQPIILNARTRWRWLFLVGSVGFSALTATALTIWWTSYTG